MKKKQITFDRKLSLDREIIGKLDIIQMSMIQGGVTTINTLSCIGNREDDNAEVASCYACSCNQHTDR